MVSKFKIFEAKFPEDDMTMNQLLKRRIEISKELESLRREALDIKRKYNEKLAEHVEKYKEKNRVEKRIRWAVKKNYKVGQKISITDFYQYLGYGDRPSYREITGLGKILSDDLEITKVNPKSVVIKYTKLVNKNIPLSNRELRTAAGGYGRISFRDDNGNYTRFVVPPDQRLGNNRYNYRDWTPTHKKTEVPEEVELRVPKKFINAIFYKKSIDAQREITKRAVIKLNEKVDELMNEINYPEDDMNAAQLLNREQEIPEELRELRKLILDFQESLGDKNRELCRVRNRIHKRLNRKFKVGDKIDISGFHGYNYRGYIQKNIPGFYGTTSDNIEITKVNKRSLYVKYKRINGQKNILLTKAERDLYRRDSQAAQQQFDAVIDEQERRRRNRMRLLGGQEYAPTHKRVPVEKEIIEKVHIDKINKIIYTEIKKKKSEMVKKIIHDIND